MEAGPSSTGAVVTPNLAMRTPTEKNGEKRTLGKQNVQLQPIDLKGDQIREYRNNPLKLMGKPVATLTPLDGRLGQQYM